MHFGLRVKNAFFISGILVLVLSVGFIFREYMYAEHMAMEYIELSFLYQSMEAETQKLKENMRQIITSDQISVKDIVYTSKAAKDCYESFVAARECANQYVEAQCNRPFPPDRMRYDGEEILFAGIIDRYETSYSLEDGLKSFENALLKSLEDEQTLLEIKNTMPMAMEDVEWLERAIPNFAENKGDIKGIIFNYFSFLEEIELRAKSFFEGY